MTIRLAAIILLIVLDRGASATGIITADTVIDANSPFNDATITVRDGADGPTSVRIANTGSVAGFSLEGSSRLVLDGGRVTFLSGLKDNSVFEVLSGVVDCSDQTCDFIDFDSVLTVEGQSRLILRGGQIGSPVRLEDTAVLEIFGRDLVLQPVDGTPDFSITGTLADYTELSLFVQSSEQGARDRIVFTEVPSPSSGVLAVLGVLSALIGRRSDLRRYSRKQTR